MPKQKDRLCWVCSIQQRELIYRYGSHEKSPLCGKCGDELIYKLQLMALEKEQEDERVA